MKSTLPPTRSVIAGPVPLYGTVVNSAWIVLMYSTPPHHHAKVARERIGRPAGGGRYDDDYRLGRVLLRARSWPCRGREQRRRGGAQPCRCRGARYDGAWRGPLAFRSVRLHDDQRSDNKRGVHPL